MRRTAQRERSTSSRIAKNKVRKLKAFQDKMYVTIDFLMELTEVYRVVNKSDSNALISVPLTNEKKGRQIILDNENLSMDFPITVS